MASAKSILSNISARDRATILLLQRAVDVATRLQYIDREE